MKRSLVKVGKCLASRKEVKIVMYGDSISEVGRTPNWFGGASSAEKNWGQRLGGMLRAKYPLCKFSVSNFGIGGQNAYEGLGRMDWLGQFKPDLVIIEFGTNDCAFHLLPPEVTGFAVGQMIDAIRAIHKADVMVVLPTGENPKCSGFMHLDETRCEIRKAADARDVQCVDILGNILKATDGGARWAEFHGGEKDCHPNDKGHEVWATAVFDAIVSIEAISKLPLLS